MSWFFKNAKQVPLGQCQKEAIESEEYVMAICELCRITEISAATVRDFWAEALDMGADRITRYCDSCWATVQATRQKNYANARGTSSMSEALPLLDWLEHYILDKQYELIPQDKDFELREVLKKIRLMMEKK